MQNKFKRVIKNSHTQYYLTVYNQTNFLEIVFEWRNMDKVKVQSLIIDAFYDKEKLIIDEKDYQKILRDGLKYFSDNTGCVDDLKVTEKLLDKLFDMKIIDSEMYRECIEHSACGRWM